ncbi:hypothetical protein JCM10213v2_006753 [Rhodosporidiobolus nylandii]
MSSSREDLFWAFAEAVGVPPAMIAGARNDPSARRLLEERLASGPSLQQPTCNIVEEGDVTDRLKRQIEAARSSFERQRDRPLHHPPVADRHRQIVSMNAQRDAVVKGSAVSGGLVVSSFMGLPKHSSDKALEELKRITFDEMYATQAHKGRYLLCRIVSLPVLQLGVSFIVEDPTGRRQVPLHYFSIYHQPLHGVKTGPDLDALFPLGQILAVKEPTFKTNQDGSGVLVRVDSPTDLVFLQLNNPLVKSVPWTFPSPAKPLQPSFDHKAHGNNFFKQKKYLLATKAYSDGLATSPPDEQKLLLHLNRAQAHLFLDNFASAYRDASAVLHLLDEDVSAPPHTQLKAQLRLARALEGMRLIDKAKQAYDAVLQLDATSEQGKDGKKRVAKMLRAAKTGEFDWLSLETQDAKARREKKLFKDGQAGDFVGPVKVVERASRGGGRGVVATRDIQAGELLMLEKAVAVGEGDTSRKSVVLALDMRTNQGATQAQLNLVDAIIAKMLDDPSVAPFIYSLYGGEDFPPATTPPFKAFPSRAAAADASTASVDTARVEAIATQNRFALREAADDSKGHHPPTALFLHASLFNHSCLANATWSSCGDMIIVRARKHIPNGDEVFIPYVSVEASENNRQKVLAAHFSKEGCPCGLCTLDRLDGASKVAAREPLLQKIRNIHRSTTGGKVDFSSVAIRSQKRELSAIIEKLEKTYSPSRSSLVRPEMAEAFHALAEVCDLNSASGRKEANVLDLKALAASGAVVKEMKGKVDVLKGPLGSGAMATPLLLCIAHRLSLSDADDDTLQARAFVRAAIRMSRILDATDGRRFIFRYGPLVEEMDIEWMVGLEFGDLEGDF